MERPYPLDESVEQQSSSAATQAEAKITLLTIPPELRENIFKQYFRSITVRRGFKQLRKWSRRFSSDESDPESLDDSNADDTIIEATDSAAAKGTSLEEERTQNTSILRTCRQLSNEALPLLALNVLLHFASIVAMLDTLTTLPRCLRQLRLKAYQFPLYTNDSFFTTYDMASTLPMFPGFQLDVLTVEDCYHDPDINDGFGDYGTYFNMHSMLGSAGWKELHYITPTAEFLTLQNYYRKGRIAQPEGWNKELREKDGDGAEVKMYVANEKSVAGSAEDSATRKEWETIPGHLLPPPPDPDWDSFDGEGWGP